MPSYAFKLNGKNVTVDAPADMPLLWVLRDLLGVTGPKYGCGVGVCRACTCHVNGSAVQVCMLTAADVVGKKVTTIEGLATDDHLHPLQEGFWEEHGLQCGYCTPGMIMAAVTLLQDNPTPSEREIREGISGNFCRCTGYQHIVNAIQHAAKKG